MCLYHVQVHKEELLSIRSVRRYIMAKRSNFYKYTPSIGQWDSMLHALERLLQRIEYKHHWSGHVLMDGSVVELPPEHASLTPWLAFNSDGSLLNASLTPWLAFNSDGSLLNGFPSLVKETKIIVKESMSKQSKDSSARGCDWNTHREETVVETWKIVMLPETEAVTEHLRSFREEAAVANKEAIAKLRVKMKEYLDNTLLYMGDRKFWSVIVGEAFSTGVIESFDDYPDYPLGYVEPTPMPEPTPEPDVEDEEVVEEVEEITYGLSDLMAKFGKKK